MKHLKTFEHKSKIKYDIDDMPRYIEAGNIKMIKKILSSGVDVNSINIRTYPVIQLSVYYMDTNIVDLLLEYGADIDDINTNNGNSTLIDFSYYSNLHKQKDLDMLYHIIDKGADWNIKNYKGWDFFDAIKNNYSSHNLDKEKLIYDIIEKYPDKYENYIMKKNINKYNL